MFVHYFCSFACSRALTTIPFSNQSIPQKNLRLVHSESQKVSTLLKMEGGERGGGGGGEKVLRGIFQKVTRTGWFQILRIVR